jgi:3-oxoacyl-[acyl-carrier-protein] synthase-1
VLLGVSAKDRPGRPSELDGTLLDEVASRLKLTLHYNSGIYPFDQFGCAQAFSVARELLKSGKAIRVVIAGVDSFLNPSTLHALNDRRRLNTPANSNGFFPGEAGAAVLVGDSQSGSPDGQLSILGIAAAHEPAPIEGTEPFQAMGLTQACQAALQDAGAKMRDVALRVTDLSGEHYKFKEAAFVAGRLDTSARSTPLDLWHPIQYLGEVGAAILPCLLAQALHAGRFGYAPGPISLCHVGSDAGERAALVAKYDGPSFTEDEE